MGDVIDLEAKRKERQPKPRPLTAQQQAIIELARHVAQLIRRIDKVERELAEIRYAARR